MGSTIGSFARARARTVVALLVVAIGVVNASPAAAHYGRPLLEGHGSATLDGVLSPGEWDTAAVISQPFMVQYPGTTGPATLFAMDDGMNLFLALRLPIPELGGGTIEINFDNNHNGLFNVGEDAVAVFPFASAPWVTATGAVDLVGIECDYQFPCRLADTNYGGRNDAHAAYARDGAFATYEISHPLRSGDPNDIALGPGDVVGLFNVTGVLFASAPGSAQFNFQADMRVSSPYFFESALMGPPHPTGDGYILTESQFLGARFQVVAPTQVDSVGGRMNGSGTLFAAVERLSGPSAMLSGSPFTPTVAAAVFTPSSSVTDVTVPLRMLLQPGTYALVFGTGRFGASGFGIMPSTNTDLPGASYFHWRGDPAVWVDGGITGVRFLVSGHLTPDTTPPTITGAADRTANALGWYDGPVTVSFTCADESGTATCSAPVTLSGDGAGQSATGTATDNAGNSAGTSVTGINIDRTAPTIAGSRTPTANASGWNNADVTVSFACSDALSGIATCSSPTTLSDEGASRSVTGLATDRASNAASRTVSGINIDKTVPTVTFSGNASTYTVDQTIFITCVASDARSGIATTSCPSVASGSATNYIGTTATTSTTVSATATDNAGNSAAASTTFTVTVTADGICRLTASLATADDICGKAMSIASAPTAIAKAGKLQAFDNFLAAQSGRSIPADLATLLNVLAHVL